MTSRNDVGSLLDCDNTLLDNDRVQGDAGRHLAREVGVAEQLRIELGYVGVAAHARRYRKYR